MDFVKGRVVISLAGRDKGRYLTVIDSTETGALVADGKLRSLTNPKKKNQKHLSPTKTILDAGALENDRALRKAINEAFGADRR